MFKLFSAFIVVVAGTPAIAQTQLAAPQPVARPVAAATVMVAKPVKPKLICETQEVIGSRLGGTRVCHTAEDWAALREDTQREVARQTSVR